MRESRAAGRFAVLGVLAALALPEAALARPEPQALALAPGDQAPVLGGVTYPVRRKYSADFGQGKLTLVNFFATWCEPCRIEMPLLEELYLRHRERGFQVIGVFERQEVDLIGTYLENVKVTYPVIRPDAIVDHYWGGVNIKPTSYLVDGAGRIVRKYVGAMPEQTAGLAADIEAYLDGQPMPPQVVPLKPALPAEVREQLEKDRRAHETQPH